MNWKTAVPQYYFGAGARGAGRIQLLLPLCLMEPDRTDLALVVDKDKSELKYRAYTVLTLSMAYKNARLISRQDSEWLGSAAVGPSVPPTASLEEIGSAAPSVDGGCD